MQAQVALGDNTGGKHCHSFGVREKSGPSLTYMQTWGILNVVFGLSKA